jgi:hypothetical protein
MKECQVNHELELENAKYVVQSLGRLVTTQQTTENVGKNTVLKSVGLFAQEFLINAVIVGSKLSLPNHRTKSFVIMNVGTMIIKAGLRKMRQLGRVMLRVIQQFISGLIDTITNQINASIVVSQELLSGLMFQASIVAKEMIGLDYASLATFTLTDTTKHSNAISDPRYCDVIRKRYWKFTTGSINGWSKGTPII